MAEMSEVVQLMLERLEVDLSGDEITQALAAFHLPLWADASSRQSLQEKAGRLLRVLGFKASLQAEFGRAATILSGQVQAAKRQGIDVGNKVAWSWLLRPCWRAKHMPKQTTLPHGLEAAVCFYLSIKANTTTLERNLGQLCRQMGAHAGHGAEDGSLTACLVEVALDGPQTEAEFFHQDHNRESGQTVLSPSSVGRVCARMWVTNFGRRFQFKYGQSGRKRRAPPPGSMKAVELRRRAAADKQNEQAATFGAAVPSFVLGLQLPLQAEVSRPQPEALASSRWGTAARRAPKGNFSKHTQRKAESHSEVTFQLYSTTMCGLSTPALIIHHVLRTRCGS